VAHAELFGEHREVVADVAVISEPTEHHHESPADSDGSDESCSVCATKAQANYMVLQGALVIAFPRVPLTLSSLDQADACISDKSASQFQARPPHQKPSRTLASSLLRGSADAWNRSF
jgi:hypothetical protein